MVKHPKLMHNDQKQMLKHVKNNTKSPEKLCHKKQKTSLTTPAAEPRHSSTNIGPAEQILGIICNPVIS